MLSFCCHPLGQLFAQLILFILKLHTREQLVRPRLPVRGLISPRDEFQVLGDGQHIEGGRDFRDIAKLPLRLQRFIGIPANADLPLKPQQTGDALDGGGLPRPVRPGHDGDLARFHLKAQMIVGQHFSIGFCQFGYRQHGGIPLSGPHPGRLYYSIPRPRL